MKVLVVCLGNICRSPMAEGWLRARIATEPGLRGRIMVDSAGLGDWHVGQAPDPRAVATAAGHGIDISRLRARTLETADFHEFDLILCADRSTLGEARSRAPAGAKASVERLLESAGLAEPLDLADPYTGDLDGFEQVWLRIEAAGDGLVRRMQQAFDA